MKLLGAALVAATILAGCAGEANESGGPAPTETPPATSGESTEGGTSVAVGGGAAMSCVEEYTLVTLATRAFAFDGTVVEIGEVEDDPESDRLGYADVTFEVHEWFRGGDAGRVTVLMMAPGEVTLLENTDYEVGSRLLVTGEPRWGGEPLDDPIAWTCGFTRTHDGPTADAWRGAFS